jgi:hypothetical protein
MAMASPSLVGFMVSAAVGRAAAMLRAANLKRPDHLLV